MFKKLNIVVLSIMVMGLVLLDSGFAESGEVTKVIKGKSVRVKLDEPSEEGALFDVVDPADGKKMGYIKLTKVKKLQAIGKIIKGKKKIQVGHTIQPRSGGDKSEESQASSTGSSKTWEVGVLLGASMDTLHIVDSNDSSKKVNAGGNGMRVAATVNWNLFEFLTLQGKLGLLTLSGANNETSPATKVSINYISLDGWLHYNFSQSLWAGAGVYYLSPSSNSGFSASNPPEATSAVGFGAGYNLHISTGYVPIQLTYDMLLGKSGNLAESISICAGYAFPL